MRQRGDDERRREAVPRQTGLVLLERLVLALPSRRPVRPKVRRHQRPPLRAAHPLPRARHLRDRRPLGQPQEPRGVEEVLRGEHLAPDCRREVAPLHPAPLVRARVAKPQQRTRAVHARGEVAAGPDSGRIGTFRDVADGHARVRQCRRLLATGAQFRPKRSLVRLERRLLSQTQRAVGVHGDLRHPGFGVARSGRGRGRPRAGAREVRRVGLHGWHVDVLGEFVGRRGRILGNLERDLHRRASELEDPEGIPRVPGEQRIGGVVGGDPGVQSFFAPRDDFGPRVPKEEGRSRQGGAAAAQDGVPRAPIGHRAKPRGGHEHDGRPRNVRVGDQAARKLVQRPERLPRAFRIRRGRAEPGLDAHHAELLRVSRAGSGGHAHGVHVGAGSLTPAVQDDHVPARLRGHQRRRGSEHRDRDQHEAHRASRPRRAVLLRLGEARGGFARGPRRRRPGVARAIPPAELGPGARSREAPRGHRPHGRGGAAPHL